MQQGPPRSRASITRVATDTATSAIFMLPAAVASDVFIITREGALEIKRARTNRRTLGGLNRWSPIRAHLKIEGKPSGTLQRRWEHKRRAEARRAWLIAAAKGRSPVFVLRQLLRASFSRARRARVAGLNFQFRGWWLCAPPSFFFFSRKFHRDFRRRIEPLFDSSNLFNFLYLIALLRVEAAIFRTC